ncbi:MAG: alpha/beta hydrolase [Cyclobacteriaceae bacterium]|uniref:alpha/beta fold hydrolase n=1 Tax=Nonlabens ulvanivorans TaxID=906888 RepID=UPI0032803A02
MGEGQPMVILHGWGSSKEVFKRFITYYSKKFKVFAPDLPGFGESETPKTPWTVYDYQEFLVTFLETLSIKSPLLVGHSHGGRISIVHAGLKNKTKGLVLLGSAGVRIVPLKVRLIKTAKKIIFIFGDNKISLAINNALNSVFASKDFKNAAQSEFHKKTVVSVINEDLRHLMPEIDSPTLLIFGKQDKDTPISHGKIMNGLIPGAKLEIIEKAGHYTFLDAESAVLLKIDKFLDL